LFVIFLLFSPAVSQGAIDFAGDDDVITLSDLSIEATPITMYARVNINDLSADQRCIIAKHSFGTSVFAMLWRIGTDGKIEFHTNDGTAAVAKTSTGVISVDTEYAIVITFDGTAGADKVDMYLDGVLQTLGGGVDDDTRQIQDTAIAITVARQATSNDEMSGVIHEVAFWTGVELTAAEILILSTGDVRYLPNQIQPSNLTFYLPLDDFPDGEASINGDTFVDRSGNGNDGTGTDGDGDSVSIAETILTYP